MDYYVNWRGRWIDSIKKTWARVRTGAAAAWFAPKMLRHTVAAELRRRGVPSWEVSGQIGHKRAGTSEIYARFDPDYLSKAARALDAGDRRTGAQAFRGHGGVSPEN
ncbi:hypothetical protein ISP15_09305 [Dyella jejuensis]|uniref:Tyr recombinase domain-containing protein n=1 Tax=Dyella jejuensis TaxID=1432009 RepID=A0ABW8JL00_9GAMM